MSKYFSNANENKNNEKTEIKIDGIKVNNPKYQLNQGSEVVSVDPEYFRPTEVEILIGDPTKAKEKLGWVAEYSLRDLINDMMKSDLSLMKKELYLKNGGYYKKHRNEHVHD